MFELYFKEPYTLFEFVAIVLKKYLFNISIFACKGYKY